jgi:hypothetical protein
MIELPQSKERRWHMPSEESTRRLTRAQYFVMKTIQRMMREDRDTDVSGIRKTFMAEHPDRITNRHIYVLLKRLKKQEYIGQIEMAEPLRRGEIVYAHYVTNAGEKAMEVVAPFYEKK